MWTRLLAVILIATSITQLFSPLERFPIYFIVISVAIPIFAIRLESEKSSPVPSKPEQNKVVELEEFRRKKDQEKKSKERKG